MDYLGDTYLGYQKSSRAILGIAGIGRLRSHIEVRKSKTSVHDLESL